jgi:uncharacterized C2H2 Zn-finger protein
MAQNRDNIPSPCPFCDKVYEWKRGLRRHISKCHVEKQALNTTAVEKNGEQS